MANAQTEQPKPCAKAKLLAWDVTVPDTFAESHLSSTTAEQGMATKQAADNNTAKYQGLEKTHIVFLAKTAEHGTSKPWNWCKKSGDAPMSSEKTSEKPFSCLRDCPWLCRG